MRVIGGVVKGRRLRGSKGMAIRPITDSLKEAIFNILGNQVVRARVLDLYAGTGSLGIEALSRGAEWVLFVDRALEAVRLIEKNLKIVGFRGQAQIWREDVLPALKRIGIQSLKFSLIFVDPPYEGGLCAKTLQGILENRIIAEGGWIVLRRHHKEDLSLEMGHLKLASERKVGEAVVDFLLLPRIN